MYTIFIDGQEGTTGLQIHQRLKDRSDIAVIEIPAERRKDPGTKQDFLNRADIVILCLPDEAARASVALITNPATRVIDASTAFRIAPDWVYGLPELTKTQRNLIKNALRVSNPGCYATGFALTVRPLVALGIIPREYPVICSANSGYSGGGKKLIAAYKAANQLPATLQGPRHYALQLKHKHIPEMQMHAGLATTPLFLPTVGPYYQGMTVTIPLHQETLPKKISPEELHNLLLSYYAHEHFITVMPLGTAALDDGFLAPTACNATNKLDLFVFGNEQHLVLAARFDNLGKGASGAAVQNMNIMLGIEETTGL